MGTDSIRSIKKQAVTQSADAIVHTTSNFMAETNANKKLLLLDFTLQIFETEIQQQSPGKTAMAVVASVGKHYSSEVLAETFEYFRPSYQVISKHAFTTCNTDSFWAQSFQTNPSDTCFDIDKQPTSV